MEIGGWGDGGSLRMYDELTLSFRLKVLLHYGVQLAGLMQDLLLMADQRDAHVRQLLGG